MLAAVLLVLLLPALVVANASEWAARTVVDDQAFTTTAAGSSTRPPSGGRGGPRRGAGRRARCSRPDHRSSRGQRRSWAPADATARRSSRPSGPRRGRPAMIRGPEARDAIIADIHAVPVGAAMGGSGSVAIRGRWLVLDTGPSSSPRDGRRRATDAGDDRRSRRRTGRSCSSRPMRIETQPGAVLLDLGRILIPIAAVVVALAIVGLAHRRVRALGSSGSRSRSPAWSRLPSAGRRRSTARLDRTRPAAVAERGLRRVPAACWSSQSALLIVGRPAGRARSLDWRRSPARGW